ncbi:MAG: hypothetical protein QM840_10155, partial [Verrucomicrobiota bacterium]|nr:hypothetical protein [Verrucomicrobiota bacterium]
ATVFTFFSTFRVMVLCLSFLGSLFTPVAYHDPLLFAELLGHYPKSYELPVSIPCTPLVHGLKAGYIQGACGIMDTAAWKDRIEGIGRGDNY